MTPHIYLTDIGHTTQCKNKLEKAFYHYLTGPQHRRVIPADQATAYRREILEHYAQLCTQHPRCKTRAMSWHPIRERNGIQDWSIYTGFGIFTMQGSQQPQTTDHEE